MNGQTAQKTMSGGEGVQMYN